MLSPVLPSIARPESRGPAPWFRQGPWLARGACCGRKTDRSIVGNHPLERAELVEIEPAGIASNREAVREFAY
jgi:hypothetical protein